MSTESRVELSAENLNNVSGGGVFRIAYEILKKVKDKLVEINAYKQSRQQLHE